ncbi:MAG: 1-deoxy-D-xylulose-5-phosphate reductoisomerase [Tepidisphaeraceae bacterium]
MPHRIAILGSTGSIGCNALEVIEHLGAPYRAVAISGNTQIDKLLDQSNRHRPSAIGVCDDRAAQAVATRAREIGAELYVGDAGLSRMVSRDDVDTVLAAMVGFAGLTPVLAAVRAGKRVALANKEPLVAAGELLMAEARRSGATILPVDSEHSAIFQALRAGRLCEVERVILTASGGPFRTASRERLDAATVQDALNHPTWQMGSKITIDSATMFNKALEIVEACWLFDLPPEKVQVVIHPESIVHSMVEFVDGSTIAQLSPPDMRTPIQFALTWPDRVAGMGRQLDLSQARALNFEPPDLDRFPALRIGFEVARRRGTLGAVMNAANETAVSAFLQGTIGFGMICRTVELTIRQSEVQDHPSMDDLIEADHWARAKAASIVQASPAPMARQ